MIQDESIAMQFKCIYCLREQYSPAVLSISHSTHPCVWCGKTPPKMTVTEYNEAITKRQKEVDNAKVD